MKLCSILSTLGIANLACAQLPSIPACSINCFLSALTSDGCSSLTDFSCHCQKTQLITDIGPCVQQACVASDQARVSSVVVSECSAVGHPISLPPANAPTSEGHPTTTDSPSPESTTINVEPISSTGAGAETYSQSASVASSTETESPTITPKPTLGPGLISRPAGYSTSFPTRTGGGGSNSSRGSGEFSEPANSSASGAKPSSTYNAAESLKGNMAGLAAAAAVAAYAL